MKQYLSSTLLGVVVALFLTGCTFVQKYDVSVPIEPSSASSDISGETISINQPGLAISAQLMDYLYSGVTIVGIVVPFIPIWESRAKIQDSKMGLWMYLKTEQTYWFDVNQVTLTTSDGSRLSPVYVVGPSQPWHSPRAIVPGCGPRSQLVNYGWGASPIGSAKPTAPSAPLWFAGSGCVVLAFDALPDPEKEFTLSIKGITQNRREVSVPDITFHKGEVWKLGVFP